MSNHQIKLNRAHALAPTLPMATQEIMDSISDTLIERLTAAELAEVIRCLNRHWHKAVAYACKDGQVIDDCLWTGHALIPLAAIRAITVTDSVEYKPSRHSGTPERWSVHTYTLDYQERL